MKISREARKQAKAMFLASLKAGKPDALLVRNAAKKLLDARPRGYLAVLKEYHRRIRLELSKRHAVIESATELDALTRYHIEHDLKAKHGTDTTFEYRINPALIAGFRARVGNDLLDGTVRGRLDRLASELQSQH